MDISAWRDEFPVLAHKTYLISASLGPVARRSRAYLEEYLDAWGTKGAPDHVWFEDIFPRMASLKRSFSALAGCDPDEVALTTNISIALATVFPPRERKTSPVFSPAAAAAVSGMTWPT